MSKTSNKQKIEALKGWVQSLILTTKYYKK